MDVRTLTSTAASGTRAPMVPRLRLLLLIRDQGSLSFRRICESFGVDPDDYGSYYFRNDLDSLERAGLLLRDADHDLYSLSPQVAQIQSALGLSFTQISKLTAQSLVVEPFLGPPDHLENAADVFVVMPFDEMLKPVWDDHIRPAVSGLGLSVSRADDFFTSHAVIADVWSALYNSRLVVADCTGRNPNVFYEMGLAHVLGRPVIMVTQNADDVPFDVRHYRYIRYEFTPRGMQDFERNLAATIETTLAHE